MERDKRSETHRETGTDKNPYPYSVDRQTHRDRQPDRQTALQEQQNNGKEPQGTIVSK
jgi:hypothetical protein